MKAIRCILVLFMVTSISRAEPTHWRNKDEIETWLRSKEKLEIAEFKNLGNEMVDMFQKGLLDGNDCTDISVVSTKLAFKRFQELLDARDLPGVCEFLEGIDGNSTVKIRMMDVLADCKDVEFSARVVHHALGRDNWESSRGFSYPNEMSRRNLFNKVMGEADTLEKILSEYGIEDRFAQKAMKVALEKKWPVLLEEPSKAREKKSTRPKSGEGGAAGTAPRKGDADHPAIAKAKPWLWVVASGLIALIVAGWVRIRQRTVK